MDWVVTIYRTHQLTVSNSLVGRIIGLRGAKINQIQVSWRKRESVCVCAYMYNVCVCVCVCVCVLVGGRESVCVCVHDMYNVCVCV